MTIMLRIAVCFFLANVGCAVQANTTHHYVFFGKERERIRQSTFLQTNTLEGAQLKYTWRELEPEKGRYDSLRDTQRPHVSQSPWQEAFPPAPGLYLRLLPSTWRAQAYLRSDPAITVVSRLSTIYPMAPTSIPFWPAGSPGGGIPQSRHAFSSS